MITKSLWTPQSWRNHPGQQMPSYDDNPQALKAVTDRLVNYPPLVFAGEVRALKQELARVAHGEAFMLQGGDCAEAFADFKADSVRDFLKVILQMALVLTWGGQTPVVKIGRIAGQFAKPRSSDTETQNGVILPSYRGDIVNSDAFTSEGRTPNPERMETAYFQSASKMNLLRAFLNGGFADLKKVHRWTLAAMEKASFVETYEKLCDQMSEALHFMDAIGLSGQNSAEICATDLYTSHECLLLEYEECFVRKDSIQGDSVATSAHLLWIGDRTRDPDGAHVEFLRGVVNPIGIKCGPTMNGDDLIRLLDILNPENEAGKITLITRMGAKKVASHLPDLITRARDAGRTVVWCCDPMHGNTIKSESGYKTRPFDLILQEVIETLKIHDDLGTRCGGIHLELTGQNVTECTGGLSGITNEDLSDRYHTTCDPRLNLDQSLEMAFVLSDWLRGRSRKTMSAAAVE